MQLSSFFPLVRASALLVFFLIGVGTGPARAEDSSYWVEPMKKVHGQFTGKRGTFAQFGDSITVTMAFWAPLRTEPKNMSQEQVQAYKRVSGYMVRDCWDKWKGAKYGSEGGMTIRWAHDNLDKWLKQHNPEVALLMFGTNDLGQLEQKEYEQKTRDVVQRCLRNGTVVILSTIPPRSGLLDKSRQFAETVRKLARELKVPLEDYFKEILDRRPDDWDGSLEQFKSDSRNEYEVPTLIARDGVHPSNPARFKDFSKESLKNNGYILRNYLTLLTYAEVIDKVLAKQK